MMLKPIIPFVEYALNYDYIVKELCEQKEEEVNTCNGKCHLSKRIQETSDDSNSSLPTEKKTEQVELLFLEKVQPYYSRLHLIAERSKFIYQDSFHKSCVMEIPDPPPSLSYV
ncbi:MAG: hypothetical protein ACK4FS_09730 [Flavobacterium sp.]